MKTYLIKKLKNITIIKLASILASFVIILAIGVIVYMNLQNRSLWLDEAMLAESVGRRSLKNLTSEKLDWVQSAPVLYLYFVKLLTIILGYSEHVLRLFSALCYILTLLFSYLILKHMLHNKHAVFGTAFVANIPLLLYYSNEFKPYMGDCFSVLLIFYAIYLFDINRIKWITFIAISCILIWFSNPVCFFIGAILVYEFINSAITKNIQRIIAVLVGGISVLFSFLVYFFYWLKPVIDAGGMSEYWADYHFPLIPTNYSELILGFEYIKTIINEFGSSQSFIAILVFSCLVLNVIYDRNKYIIIITIGIFITLSASMLGMFPVATRLFLFIYPILSLLAFNMLDKWFGENISGNITLVLLFIILIFSQKGISKYIMPNAVFIEQQEANSLIEYVQNNILEGEELYVYYSSIPVFEFKNGYDNYSIGEYENNVILGKGFFENDKNQNDIDYILNQGNMYLLFSHTYIYSRYENLINSLNSNGYLQKIKEEYNTPLFYYTNKLEKSKIKCKLELINYTFNDEKKEAIIRIKNIGNAYLNNGYEELLLCARNKNSLDNEILSEMYIKDVIAPGDEIELSLNLEEIENLNSIDIQIVNEGKYWFDNIGVKSLVFE